MADLEELARQYRLAMAREVSAEEFSVLMTGSSVTQAWVTEGGCVIKTTDDLTFLIHAGGVAVIPVVSEDLSVRIKIELNHPTGGPIPVIGDAEFVLQEMRELYAMISWVMDGMGADPTETSFPSWQSYDHYMPDDGLRVRSIGEGSIWLTLASWGQKNIDKVQTLASLFYEQGRGALLRRIEAKTQLSELEVKRKEIEVAKDFIVLGREIEKIKDCEIRDEIKKEFFYRLTTLGARPEAIEAVAGEETVARLK